MGGKKKAEVIGYWYGATMHCGIGLAMDELFKIIVGGKTAWSGSIKQNGSIGIANPWLFGGIKGEGGIWGNLQALFGKKDQGRCWLLTRLLGNNIPAYRGTATVVFDGWMCALNPYPKEWAFCYRRVANGWPDDTPWYPEKISIWLANGQIQAMNPAHMLYESYISDTWGSGELRVRMDDAAFKKAADTLYEEQFGLCLEWKTTDEIKKFRDLVCDHIGAKVGTDPRTGLITIRLIRDDYVLEEIPTFDEDSGLLDIKFDSTNNTEVPSQVVVKYTDAASFQECSIAAVNPAVAQGQNGRNTETTDYAAIPTGELAIRVAFRDLKAKTSALKRCEVKLDRRAYDLVLGQPFRIKTKYRTNNIDIVVRAERIQEKFLTDGTISITALEDVFALPKINFNPVPVNPGQWQPLPPEPITDFCIIEVPYRELAGLIDQANLNLLDASTSYFFIVAKEPNASCRSYELLSRVQGANKFNDADTTFSWCPVAQLANAIGYTDTIIHIDNGYLLEALEEGTAAIIDNEIVRLDKIDLDNNQLVVGRGCADTVPMPHNEGVTIWFYDNFEATDGIEYTTGLTVETKLISTTANAMLAENIAPIETITLTGRQARPYAPGNVKVNNLTYPEIVDDYLTISWSHRNRLIQADQLIDTTIGDVTPEQETTYNLMFYTGGTLIKKVTGLTATSYTFKDEVSNFEDVSLLQFEDNLIDEAGNNWLATGTPTFVDGKVQNKAIRFNETNGLTCLTNNSGSAFDFKDKTDFTIECWIRITDNTPNYGCIIASNRNSFDSLAYFLMLKGNSVYPNTQRNRLVFGGQPYSDQTIIQSTTALLLNEWYHVAVTRQDDIFKLFLNGQLENQTTMSTSINFSAGGTLLGRNKWDGNNGLFKGDIDQFRISKGCLYTANFTPATEPYQYNAGVALNKEITVELASERAGLTSYQTHHFTVKRS